MKPKHLDLFLCFAGTILPYRFLIPFLREYGLDLRRVFEELFANRISSFFGMDVIIASVCLWDLCLFSR